MEPDTLTGRTVGHHSVLEPLGEGGMGFVYKARDTRLRRLVAIKVLRPERIEEEADRRRFLREAQAAAALNHPHIVTVYEVGVEEGLDYIVMEYIAGGTLADLMAAGRLPLERVLRLTAQVTDALAAAHAAEIVHRDLKPSNIMLASPDHAKVVDFGLAKFCKAAPTPEADAVSRTGVLIGTAAYMSPEQIAGRGVDGRSDVWALGAVLYEMASGRRPFPETNTMLLVSDILNRDPEPPSTLDPQLPPGLEKVILKALEKDPAYRYQSARELGLDLTRLTAGMPPLARFRRRPVSPPIAAGIAAALVAAVLGGTLWWAHREGSTKRGTSVKRVAVLPFENLGAPEDDYFADGITDDVRGKLTKVSGLEVIARTSSNGYRKTAKKPQEIGKELDAEYLLTGTVRFAADVSGSRRVQVSPELVVASSAASKWTQPFDATLTDVFRVQGEIATKVTEALDVALSSGTKKGLEAKPTQNLAAYEAYLRGEQASQGTAVADPASLRRATEEYEKAVALDAGFVAAWARLGHSLSNLYAVSTPTPALAARAREAAEKAVALGPERPEGHAALSAYYRSVPNDSARALAEAERARAFAPGDAFTLVALALAEQRLGRWEESLGHLEEARRLDPRSAITLQRLGNAALFLRRTAKAREAFDTALSLAPTNLSVLETRATTNLQDGDLPGARRMLRSAPKEVDPAALVAFVANYWDLVWVLDEEQRDLLLRLALSAFDDDRGVWALCLAQAYALAHDEANVKKYADIARAASTEQLTVAPEDSQRHAVLGLSLAYLGRKDEAIREARKAVALLPVSKDAYLGPYVQHQLVRVYILTGEHEKAIDTLKELLRVPYFVTRGWLGIDPNFDPLRKNPRFQRLVEGR
ncbi:MAG: protein kinase domain-containing protein [Acidobacteriota bacterium]